MQPIERTRVYSFSVESFLWNGGGASLTGNFVCYTEHECLELKARIEALVKKEPGEFGKPPERR